MPEVFTNRFIIEYERFSSTGVYDYGDRNLADARRAFVGSNRIKQLFEIGCRTGNSTLVLAQLIPVDRIVSFEENPLFLTVAKYKFGAASPKAKPLGKETPVDIANFINKQKEQAKPFRSLVEFQLGNVPDFTLPKEEADEVVCSQTFHWLAFETPTSPPSFDRLTRATSKIAQALKPDGLFLFNSNGHILKFGEEEINGRKIDDFHWTNNPFRTGFNLEFAELIHEMGLSYSSPNPQEPSYLPGLLNLRNIEDTLEVSGLKLLNQPDGKPYRISFWRYGFQEMLNSLRRAGPLMTHFNQPGLSDLPEDEKIRLIDLAIQRIINKDPVIVTKPYYETFFGFVAQKQ